MRNHNEINYDEFNQACKILKNNGFYTGNLWQIEDVKIKFNCDNETAYDILHSVLNNDYLISEIQQIIYDIATGDPYNLTEKEEN